MIRENIAVSQVCSIDSYHRISWSAIIIGALVGTGLGFLLNLFGMAIGLSAFSAPTQGGALTFAIGGFLGLVIAVIAGMLAAGYAAGFIGRLCCPHKNLGILYGFATWTLTLLISALLAGSVSHYISAYAHSAANQVLSSNASLVSPELGESIKNTPKPAAQSNAKTDAAVNKQLNSKPGNPLHLSDAAWMACIAFILFFIGAISSCLGAIWAMCRCKKDDIV